MAGKRKARLRRKPQAKTQNKQATHETKSPEANAIPEQIAMLPAHHPDRAALVLQLQRTLGNRATQQLLQRSAPSDIQRDPPTEAYAPVAVPEDTTVDATGSYEAIDPGGGNRITLQFNQAGYHIEGWYQRRVYRSHTNSPVKQTMRHYRIRGNMISDDPTGGTVFQYSFQRESDGSETSSGRLVFREVDGEPRLHMDDVEGWSHDFRRTSTTARPPDQALEALPDENRDLLTASVNAPLDSEELANLMSNAEVIKRRMRDYLPQSHIRRMGTAANIDNDVETILEQYAPEQQVLVKHKLKEALSLDSYQYEDTTRTYWDWLHLTVIDHPGFTETLQGSLGFRAGADGTVHKYRYMYLAGGLGGDVGIGAGAYLGTLIIEKSEPDEWKQSYVMGIGQVSIGPSAGVTAGVGATWTDFETLYPYARNNFEGFISLFGVQGTASAGAGGGGSASSMTFHGDGTFPSVMANGVGVALESGAHWGIEAGATLGYIGGAADEVISQVDAPTPVEDSAEVATEETLHFEVDSDQLSAEGIEAVRTMAALNLTAFENSNSSLQVDGYTSTTADDEHNQKLSERRAHNVVQQLRDSLGRRFLLAEDNISVTGHGETPARDSGEADETENRDWRKVEIMLNGETVLTLH